MVGIPVAARRTPMGAARGAAHPKTKPVGSPSRMLLLSLARQIPRVLQPQPRVRRACRVRACVRGGAGSDPSRKAAFSASVFFFSVFTYNAAPKETCERNHGQCSAHAFCTDYTAGFCCHCQSSFFGDGKHCLQEGDCWGWGRPALAAGSPAVWTLHPPRLAQRQKLAALRK